MTSITLPWPPAVNNLFFNVGKRRVRTKRYDAWLADALAAVLQQQPAPVLGSFSLSMVCVRPDRRKRDLDGLAKAPLDLLVKAGIIEDDSLCVSLGLSWADQAPAKPGCVHMQVQPA